MPRKRDLVCVPNTRKVTGSEQRLGRGESAARRRRGAHSGFGAASSGGVKNCHCGVSRAALQRSNSMPESGETPSGGAQPQAGARSGVGRAAPDPSALLTPESGGTGSTPSSSSTCHETSPTLATCPRRLTAARCGAACGGRVEHSRPYSGWRCARAGRGRARRSAAGA